MAQMAAQGLRAGGKLEESVGGGLYGIASGAHAPELARMLEDGGFTTLNYDHLERRVASEMSTQINGYSVSAETLQPLVTDKTLRQARELSQSSDRPVVIFSQATDALQPLRSDAVRVFNSL